MKPDNQSQRDASSLSELKDEELENVSGGEVTINVQNKGEQTTIVNGVVQPQTGPHISINGQQF